MKLAEELPIVGWRGTPNEFRERLADIFNGEYRNHTDEDLLCNPRNALHFCNVIRAALRIPDAPDILILRTLTNMRKSHKE
jgi:hypothetical protein